MFNTPTSYSQTNSDEFVQEQSEQPQQQMCAEGEVFNEQTQICESTTSTTEELAAPAEVATEDTNGDGIVDELDTATTEADIAQIEEEQQAAPAEGVEVGPAEIEEPTPGVEVGPAEIEEPTPGVEVGPAEIEEGQQQGTITIPEVVIRNYESENYPCDPNSETLFWDGKIPVKYNEKVVALQTYLKDLGFHQLLEPEGVDGKFGPHTQKAVIEFQKYMNLSPDGIRLTPDGVVGPQTWQALCSEINKLIAAG